MILIKKNQRFSNFYFNDKTKKKHHRTYYIKVVQAELFNLFFFLLFSYLY